ncbi:FAD-dependent monooxygenase [Neisseria leonii]|uniref:FAD-dependent monooxygenase n=1 Tax=Neisseria leonii TaxID=2995413 RepID=UPI00237A1FE9|nr:FAD-dependent monooxygenase [Neisseria sp. 3986]MDD9326304.1 FAD-dependent monooxygenase [Neisseria sp. 3986]
MMHIPVQTPRRSLYFHYKIYPYFFSKEPTVSPENGVTVVGAGPIGMLTALILADWGIPVVLIHDERQLSEGSRALVYTKRSMDILAAAGAVQDVAAQALPWTHGNSVYKGRTVFRMASPTDRHDRFAPLNNLQQNYLEEALLRQIGQNSLIELRWGNKVIDLLQKDNEVLLTVDTPEGSYCHRTPWLVAADGGRSFIRRHLGLKMEGNSYEGRFVIADIRIDLDYPTERLAFFSPDWNPGKTILMHREPHNIWRFDWQIDPDVPAEQALSPENLQYAVQSQLEMIGKGHLTWELDWCTVYSAKALTLPDYVHNNIVFAGDAAHLLPIFGVRGANTGFQDAFDLGWKLAGVIHGWAKRSLLESYSADRVGAAREICAEAGKSTRFMSPPSEGYRLLRDAVLSLSLQHDFVRPLFHWRTSRAHVYRTSLLNSGCDDDGVMTGGAENGSLFPDYRFADGSFLYGRLANRFTAVYFSGSGQPEPAYEAEMDTLQAAGIPIQSPIIRLNQDMPSECQSGRTPGLSHPDDSKRYGAQEGTVYLVRPDHHVMGRWQTYQAGRLTETFKPFCARL